MSHHYSGPNNGFPHGDARLDLTDLYAFPKPGDASKSILVMDVHPSFTFDPSVATTSEPFAADALYEFKIDIDGDAVADIAYRVRFSPFTAGAQTATLRYAEGIQAAGTGDDGRIILQGAPVSMCREARVTDAGDLRFFAGWRSDPFFFDPLGALAGFSFSGKDFFTEKDVCSIVLELPSSGLGSREVGLWARTLDGANGTWVQADRGAKPSQAIFLTGDAKGAYLAAEPAKAIERDEAVRRVRRGACFPATPAVAEDDRAVDRALHRIRDAAAEAAAAHLAGGGLGRARERDRLTEPGRVGLVARQLVGDRVPGRHRADEQMAQRPDPGIVVEQPENDIHIRFNELNKNFVCEIASNRVGQNRIQSAECQRTP